MSGPPSFAWPALFLLGVYHGVNPGMGWLFAVALGMQEKSARAVVRALVPIGFGHALAIAAAVLVFGLFEIVLALRFVKIAVAAMLLALGFYRVVRHRHFRWVGMQVGFRDLTFWSFLMASAHGAGLMVLPIVMQLPASAGMQLGHRHMNMSAAQTPLVGILATLVHTAGYLVATGALAVVVYEKAGLGLLRRAWFNLDLIWALALIATGAFALAM